MPASVRPAISTPLKSPSLPNHCAVARTMARRPAAPVVMRVPSMSQRRRRFFLSVIPSEVSRTRNVVEESLYLCNAKYSERFLDFARNDNLPRPDRPVADRLSPYRTRHHFLARAGTRRTKRRHPRFADRGSRRCTLPSGISRGRQRRSALVWIALGRRAGRGRKIWALCAKRAARTLSRCLEKVAGRRVDLSVQLLATGRAPIGRRAPSRERGTGLPGNLPPSGRNGE